jgi:hypothetical protein
LSNPAPPSSHPTHLPLCADESPVSPPPAAKAPRRATPPRLLCRPPRKTHQIKDRRASAQQPETPQAGGEGGRLRPLGTPGRRWWGALPRVGVAWHLPTPAGGPPTPHAPGHRSIKPLKHIRSPPTPQAGAKGGVYLTIPDVAWRGGGPPHTGCGAVWGHGASGAGDVRPAAPRTHMARLSMQKATSGCIPKRAMLDLQASVAEAQTLKKSVPSAPNTQI